MRTYAEDFSTLETPQSEPIPGKDQVENQAGGHSFAVDMWVRLDRFLILGNEGGSYYANERKMTGENATSILECIKADGKRTVDRIAEISIAGRAPKNDPAVFALAMCAGKGDQETRRYALAFLSKVCRIGTHLFQFLENVKQFRGWGRMLRRGVARWYLSKEPKQLAYQVTKYKQRAGWSHRDVLRQAHPKAEGELNIILKYAADKLPVTECLQGKGDGAEYLAVCEQVQHADKERVADLVRQHRLPREVIPTEMLNEPMIWDAMLDAGMPMTALIRNLATMTRLGVLSQLGKQAALVCEQIIDAELLKKARVHPITLLSALRTYSAGHGIRGQHTWKPVGQIIDALDEAFPLAFDAVEPTGKRWMLALDVSGSMSIGDIAGVPGLTPRDASAAMALVTASTEPNHWITGFSTHMVDLNITPRQRLDNAIRAVSGLPFAGTDCAQPMLHALKKDVPIDVFVVYTDSETWHGRIHPCQALQMYRQKMGIPAKLIVVGMVANDFSIADPDDAGMMDIVGFDTAVPNLMSDFALQGEG